MSIVIPCSGCGKRLKIKTKASSGRGRCPYCETSFSFETKKGASVDKIRVRYSNSQDLLARLNHLDEPQEFSPAGAEDAAFQLPKHIVSPNKFGESIPDEPIDIAKEPLDAWEKTRHAEQSYNPVAGGDRQKPPDEALNDQVNLFSNISDMSNRTKWRIGVTALGLFFLVGVIFFAMTGGGSPQSSFERLAKRVNSQLGSNLPGLEPGEKGPSVTKRVSFDVRKTDSLISPYEGTIFFQTTSIGGTLKIKSTDNWQAFYAFQEGKWVLKQISTRMESSFRELNNLTIDFYPEPPESDYLRKRADHLVKLLTP